MGSGNPGFGTGVVFVLVATLGWSLSGVFVRFLPSSLDGWQINTWRAYWMAVALLVFLVAKYGRGTLACFTAIPLFALVVTAFFFTFGSTAYVTSLTLAGTATVSVIGAASPVFTGLLSPWVTGEKPGLEAWVAAILAFIGVGIIAWDGLEAGRMSGILVALLVPICFAGQTLMLRRYRGYDMIPAMCLGGFVCFIVAGLMGFTAGHPGGGFDVDPQSIAVLALMGLVQLAIPITYYAKGAKEVAAITLSLIVMLDAVLNPLWPWLAFGEQPGMADFIGGGIIIGAVMISIFGNQYLARGARAAQP